MVQDFGLDCTAESLQSRGVSAWGAMQEGLWRDWVQTEMDQVGRDESLSEVEL